MEIKTAFELRQLYAAPMERALKKQIAQLDIHCRNFIALSPFVVVATADAGYNVDASPRGGDPGFVKALDEHTLLIPDSPGNNRLDTFENIIATGKIGLIFMIPGFNETLRVNGTAVLSRSPDDIALCTTERRVPPLVVRVSVEAAYLHCAKAFMRSKLWDREALTDRSKLPSAGQMMSEQTGLYVVPETQEELARRLAPDL